MPKLHQIKASAGSGKTFALTNLYLHLLENVKYSYIDRSACSSDNYLENGPQNILAITFTNAAAGEMSNRILLKLKKIALGIEEPINSIDKEKAKYWVDIFTRDFELLNIRTIDSLLHLIVRAAALDLEIHPNFQIVFVSNELLDTHLEAFSDNLVEDSYNYNLLKEIFLAQMHFGNAHGFNVNNQIYDSLCDLFSLLISNEFEDLTPAKKLKEKLQLLENDIISFSKKLLDASKIESVKLKFHAENALSDIVNGKLEKCIESKAIYNKDIEDLYCKGANLTNEIKIAYQNYDNNVVKLYNKYEVIKRSLRIFPLIELTNLLIKEFWKNRSKNETIPYIIIPKLAKKILNSEFGVPELICRLGTRLNHFMIDEFQDTSKEQWETILPLVEEALSRGGSLTWVGDIKQSIYGFRGGDYTLFDSINNDSNLLCMQPEIKKENLPFNWRSKKNIVKHNNVLFNNLSNFDIAQQFLEICVSDDTPKELILDAAKHVSTTYSMVEQKSPDSLEFGGIVVAEKIEYEDKKDLDNKVNDFLYNLLITKIEPKYEWSDVFILVRTKDQAKNIAESLLMYDIPVITENSLLVSEHSIIKQLTAFLQFLNNPNDSIAFWTVICGSILLEHPEAKDINWDLLHDWCTTANKENFHKSFKEQFPNIWEIFFLPFYNQVELLTTYDLLLEWISFMQIIERFPSDVAFIQRFMEIIYVSEEKGVHTISEFLEYWDDLQADEKIPMSSKINAIRILTIHAAKGLQSKVVMVPYTDFSPKKVDDQLYFVQEDDLRFITKMTKYLGNVYYKNILKDVCESINLLYVAFTRAEEELYYFYQENIAKKSTESTKKSFLNALNILCEKSNLKFPYIFGEQENIISNKTKIEQKSPIIAHNSSLTPKSWKPMNWLPQLKICHNLQSQLYLTEKERGSIIHFCLEQFALNRQGKNIENIINSAIQKFKVSSQLIQYVHNALFDILTWLISIPDYLLWIKNGYPEHSIVDDNGKISRIDLFVKEEWGLLIIDYKTGKKYKENIEQIQNYIKILSKSFVDKKILGLLLYLDQKSFQGVSINDHTEITNNYNDIIMYKAK